MVHVVKKSWKFFNRKQGKGVLTWELQKKRSLNIKEERNIRRAIIEERKRKKAEYVKAALEKGNRKSLGNK